MPRNPEKQRLVGIIAGLSHWRPDDPQLPALKAELATVRLCMAIAAETKAHRLTPEQRARIASAPYANLGNG